MTTKVLEKVLGADDLTQLDLWVKAHGTPQQVVLRSRIGLAAAGCPHESLRGFAGMAAKASYNAARP